jgi:hypothetical protein
MGHIAQEVGHQPWGNKSEMQHLQVIKDRASNQHGVSCLKVVRVNEYGDTHGKAWTLLG